MACRGYYTALLPQEASTLVKLTDVDSRLEFLDSLYASADADHRIQSVDKSWDAMHRCLCDGWLDAEHGDETKRACVLGARQLSDRPDWIISYVEPRLAKRVVAAIDGLTRDWFKEQYFSLDRNPPGVGVHRYEMYLVDTEIDFDYTWEYFVQVRDFYQRTVNRDLAIVFQVDQ
ncbi:DUF1877 family protein [Gemmata sp. G18]|uniref:DUF1877 family protein n=1 Tax=Gemmata palustris TaxID=2822762 RepID=A0ABS5BK78_9BACT|nr:DUF1877 family protein [Gemmata palustris]MBP3954107.1 DUF1877 family protein [Gemmata palustris]